MQSTNHRNDISCPVVEGLLGLRTAAVAGTFAVATSVASRTDAAHAAAYQVCLQLWLASSLLADSLAVAAQSIMARRLAVGDARTARCSLYSAANRN